ncbi:MAG: ATP-binding cassette domain-containing protein, partial [Gammaproteobacteria bacterium]|nr:ATP-binding cassette domain-containing protein [Gammaproteobacteria bacterium]
KNCFEKINESNRRLHVKMASAKAGSVQLIQLLAVTALAAVIFMFTMEPMPEENTVGTFMSLMVAMAMLLAPMKRLTTVNASLQKGIVAAQNIFEVLDSDPEEDNGTHTMARARGDVEYRNVSFIYDTNKGQVLKGIDLHIKPGETVAFVGRSGSGKSTLVSLLPRFYNAQSGDIFLDGLDIKSLSLSCLREQLALVDQNVTLFNDTIANNIAYGQQDKVSRADIVRAAESAYAMEFINKLPDGLDTMVGENGVLLSGGQRQRLAIARALLKDAPVLILDEATASLDTESERHIQKALDHLMKARTTLVIAHRLSTIENADTILVLDEGVIVERGTHKQLLQQRGIYAELYRMQFNPVSDET